MKNNNTFTYALPNSKETRDGARACIHAMKKVRKLVQNPKDENYTCEELFRIRDAAGQIMLDAAGANLPPFMAGFILIFAQHIEAITIYGVPNLYYWNPESIKTIKQIEAMRKEHVDDYNKFMSEEVES